MSLHRQKLCRLCLLAGLLATGLWRVLLCLVSSLSDVESFCCRVCHTGGGADGIWDLKYYPKSDMSLVFAADFLCRLEMGSQLA